MDLYTTNNDFTGKRTLYNNKELVEFHSESGYRVWFNEQTDDFEAHWHKAMEIIVPLENYYDVVINNESFHLIPGEVLIIAPGLVHEIKAPDSGTRLVYLMDINVFTEMKGFSAISPMLSAPIRLNKQSYPLVYDEVRRHLDRIRDIYFNREEFSQLKIHSHMANILLRLAENHSNADDTFPNTRIYKQREYAQKFSAILNYIEAHYTEDLILEDIAAISGFSKFHFSRLFKQYTDMTFCDYLNYRRLRAAEDLLAKSELSITELALQAGFPSISTFNRIFKQKHGITPSAYRSKRTCVSIEKEKEKAI